MTYRFLQQWTSNLWDDSGRGNGSRNKLRTYRMFKQDFYLEPYLLQIKDSAMRRSLCCFRISCHPSRLRGEDIIDQDLFQQVSDIALSVIKGELGDEVEDETHFLLECNSYADEQCLLFQSPFPLLGQSKICSPDKLRGPHRNYVHSQVCPYMFFLM